MASWLPTTLVSGLAMAAGACAQAGSAKPVTHVAPFPPGGSTDTIARAIGPSLTAFQQHEFARWKKVIEVGTITAD